MRTIGLLIAAPLMTACVAAGPRTADLKVHGPYAKRLSQSDIQEIIAIVGSTPHTVTRHISIDAIAPAKVDVEYDQTPLFLGIPGEGGYHYWHKVTKLGGKWIDPASETLEIY